MEHKDTSEHSYLTEFMREMTFHVKADGKIAWANPAFLKILRYQLWELEDKTIEDLLCPESITSWQKIKSRLKEGVHYDSIDLVFLNRFKEPVIATGSFHPVMEGIELQYMIGIFEDVTERRQTERERDFLFIFVVDLLCILDFDGIVRKVNPLFETTLGYSEDFLRGKAFIRFVHAEDENEVKKGIEKAARGIRSSFEVRCLRKNGQFEWLSWTVYPSSYQKRFYLVGKNLSQNQIRGDELRKMAYTDELTGLLNRRGLQIVAEKMIKIAVRRKAGFLLMLADLDGMKLINDRFGHKQGDETLIQVAHLLKERFRGSDVIARIGGDEFVAGLITETENPSKIIRHSLEEAIAKFNQESQWPHNLSLSFGFAFSRSQESVLIEDLLLQADKSMYQHKKAHRFARIFR